VDKQKKMGVVSLERMHELEHVGRAGRVRERNWTLPTVGRLWPTPHRGVLVLAAAGFAALAGAPPPVTGQERARGRTSAAPEGALARACHTAAPRQRQERDRERAR